MSQIVVPLPPRRSTPAIALLLVVGIIVPLLLVWMLVRLAVAPLPTQVPPLPTMIPAATRVTMPGVQDVNVLNFPTATVTTTPWPLMTKTPGLPLCPVQHGERCQVGARVALRTPVPTAMPVYCTAENLAMMAPRTVCEWVEPTPSVGMFR